MSTRYLTDADLAAAGVGVAHHFGGDVYLMESSIPAGHSLTQHAHDHDHLAYLVSGQAAVEIDGEVTTVTGPRAMLIKAGKVHGVTALTPVMWLCAWNEKLELQTAERRAG